MNVGTQTVNHRPLSRVALLAFVLSILTIAVVVMAAVGFRMEWWGYGSSLKILRAAAYGGAFTAMVSLAAIMLTWPGRRRRGLVLSVSGLLIVTATLAMPLYWNHAKSRLPPIQDISTDLENPPEFWEAPTSRTTHPGEPIAEQQRAAYPDIQALTLAAPSERVLADAVALVAEFGWKLVAADPGEGRIEATVTTFWYGFKDDVVIRLTPTGANTRVDMRSTSRFGGGGDGGSNANRIRNFLEALKKSASR